MNTGLAASRLEGVLADPSPDRSGQIGDGPERIVMAGVRLRQATHELEQDLAGARFARRQRGVGGGRREPAFEKRRERGQVDRRRMAIGQRSQFVDEKPGRRESWTT